MTLSIHCLLPVDQEGSVLGQGHFQKNTPLVCACLDNSKHIQWMEIEAEVRPRKLSEQAEHVDELKASEKYHVSGIYSPQPARCSCSLLCCSCDSLSLSCSFSGQGFRLFGGCTRYA